MKKYLYTQLIIWCGLFAGMSGMVSCVDYLDKAPETNVAPEDAFKNFTNFQGFVEELYHCVPDFSKHYWNNSFNWGEEEIIVATATWFVGYMFDQGNFWGWMSEYNGWGCSWLDHQDTRTNMDAESDGIPHFRKRLWPLAWYGLRKANMGLESLELLEDATSEEKDLIAGQLYFFRGWFHFTLMSYFGGLPYIDEVLPSDQKLELPRLNYRETALRAADDFEAAARLLPIDWDDTTAGRRTLGKNQQRINKIMAYGYLGKNYLYAASPLMNYESTGSRTYDTELCIKAAEAFAELLNLSESGQSKHKLVDFDDYSSIFYSHNKGMIIPGEPEAIFQSPVYSGGATRWSWVEQYVTDRLGSGTCFSPTANYINYYGMANGLPITNAEVADPESGYDPENPWEGRDPRFYHDIIYDGVKMIQGDPQDKGAYQYAHLYNGGAFRDENNGSRTGYLLGKFISDDSNDVDKGWNSLLTHVSYMRLADVYLMYAEAALHGYGSPSGKHPNYNKTAIEAVDYLRSHRNMPGIHSKFRSDKDLFMGELIRERAVELAYEGHRFNDLRRWFLLTEYPYTIKTAHDFDRGDDPDKPVKNLKERVILTRDFSSKHYWLPLKRSEVTLYPGFGQNPGW